VNGSCPYLKDTKKEKMKKNEEKYILQEITAQEVEESNEGIRMNFSLTFSICRWRRWG
jgi:hypothetical protein